MSAEALISAERIQLVETILQASGWTRNATWPEFWDAPDMFAKQLEAEAGSAEAWRTEHAIAHQVSFDVARCAAFKAETEKV